MASSSSSSSSSWAAKQAEAEEKRRKAVELLARHGKDLAGKRVDVQENGGGLSGGMDVVERLKALEQAKEAALRAAERMEAAAKDKAVAAAEAAAMERRMPRGWTLSMDGMRARHATSGCETSADVDPAWKEPPASQRPPVPAPWKLVRAPTVDKDALMLVMPSALLDGKNAVYYWNPLTGETTWSVPSSSSSSSPAATGVAAPAPIPISAAADHTPAAEEQEPSATKTTTDVDADAPVRVQLAMVPPRGGGANPARARPASSFFSSR